MMEYDIAIIGAGPAGILAAIAANCSNVVLLEKNSQLARKLLLTGGGRCNITNSKSIKKLLNEYDDKNFLKHSFYTFTNEDLYSLLDLEFIEEDNNRVFPKSQKAGDVLDALKKHLENVDVKLNYEVTSISDDFIINNEIKAGKIIIATGGVTYPQTGCDIKNYSLTNQKITKIKYGLAPLITKEDLAEIAGITLYDVVATYKKTKIKGDVLISHVGLTGPAIIDLSNTISKYSDYDLRSGGLNINEELAIDLCPEITHDELNEKFKKDFQNRGKMLLKNYLKLFLTNNFIEYFLDKIHINGEEQLSKINKKTKNRLIENLKRFSFHITDFNEKLSKITIGGVDLSDVNSKTMESRTIRNLYFAGEVLDVHGPTGGYNLKIAFSTGYLAGKSASEQ